ncbi:MAG: V-type ATP synthase subunit D [Oscillospiraceae bacterium]|jgi:V/A-type H+-transporting ATPase subunit D|nr:V-type ATP synthase subunit D [Oscillospiraceae bacterium]
MAIKATGAELNRLNSKLNAALGVHKQLKDKLDELIRQYLPISKENKILRERVENQIAAARSAMSAASALMPSEMLEQALLYPKRRVAVVVSYKDIAGVTAPEYDFRRIEGGGSLPYGYAMTAGELDDAILTLDAAVTDMLELARVEKTVQLLSVEIKKINRRVNALEYVTIPELKSNINHIRMKIDENERSDITRLMKAKETRGFL